MKNTILLTILTAWVVSAAAQWETIPGSSSEIEVGANGTIWCLGVNKTTGGYSIHRWNGSGWETMPGGAMHIDVGPNGNPYIVNDANSFFKWDGSQWIQMPGYGSDISVGANGAVWCLGSNKAIFGGYTIHRWNGTGWDDIKGGAVHLDVDPNGNAWTVTEGGTINKWNGSGWQQMPSAAKDISIAPDGSAWILSPTQNSGNHYIYKFVDGNWQMVDGGLVTLSGGPNGMVYGTNNEGTIWKRKNNADSEFSQWYEAKPDNKNVISCRYKTDGKGNIVLEFKATRGCKFDVTAKVCGDTPDDGNGWDEVYIGKSHSATLTIKERNGSCQNGFWWWIENYKMTEVRID